MSIALMAATWKLGVGATDKIVLLALADRADDDGKCWPGVASLAKKCGLSERSVQRAIQALEDGGHLTRRERHGTSSDYVIHPGKRPSMQGYTPPEYHYVYRTENERGEFYVGARSTLDAPERDDYLGSGVWVAEQKKLGARLAKDILAVYSSREELSYGELSHVAAVYGQALCRNRKLPAPRSLSPTGFRGTPDTVSPRQTVTPTDSPNTPDTVSPYTSVIHQSETVTREKPFDAFWKVYPVRKGKLAASRCFDRAVKRDGLSRVMNGVKRYAAHLAKHPPDDPQYLPHPSTWLNQGRYDDELESPANGNGNHSRDNGRMGRSDQPRYRPDPAWDNLKRLNAELGG